MQPSVGRLKSARKDIADALAAIEQGEGAGISPIGNDLLEELWQLEDSAWSELLASLEGDDLYDVLTRLREVFSDPLFSPIREIGHRAFFDFPTKQLVVEMHFVKGDGKSLEVRQDLEDTLRIGAAIIKCVADVMGNLDMLSADVKRQCLGEDFEGNLKRAARGVEEIERIFNSVGDR